MQFTACSNRGGLLSQGRSLRQTGAAGRGGVLASGVRCILQRREEGRPPKWVVGTAAARCVCGTEKRSASMAHAARCTVPHAPASLEGGRATIDIGRWSLPLNAPPRSRCERRDRTHTRRAPARVFACLPAYSLGYGDALFILKQREGRGT